MKESTGGNHNETFMKTDDLINLLHIDPATGRERDQNELGILTVVYVFIDESAIDIPKIEQLEPIIHSRSFNEEQPKSLQPQGMSKK